MSTVTVVVAVWNVLMLAVLVVAIVRRRWALAWITGLDHEVRGRWDLGDDDVWGAFLADRPELSRDDRGPSR